MLGESFRQDQRTSSEEVRVTNMVKKVIEANLVEKIAEELPLADVYINVKPTGL